MDFATKLAGLPVEKVREVALKLHDVLLFLSEEGLLNKPNSATPISGGTIVDPGPAGGYLTFGEVDRRISNMSGAIRTEAWIDGLVTGIKAMAFVGGVV